MNAATRGWGVRPTRSVGYSPDVWPEHHEAQARAREHFAAWRALPAGFSVLPMGQRNLLHGLQRDASKAAGDIEWG